ncbi:MAG: NDP-sugar synthase [candidate division WOR-3 bacterium]|nr:MAG: NDP-sugar synthase [candidate division WOR-3 bacterium]
MKAILLAAGYGNRLKPITDKIPKPLLPIVENCMIDINLKRLLNAGSSCVGVNLFHKHEIIEHHLRKYEKHVYPAVEDILKGTGGALLNFREFTEDDFIIQSSDVISDISYEEILNFHRKNGPVATLVMVRHQGTKFRIDKENRIERILGYDTAPYTYAGIGVFSKRIYSFLPEQPVFTIVDVLRKIFRKNEPILGIPAVIHWYNINSFYDYWKIHADLLQGRTVLDGLEHRSPFYIAPSSRVETKDLCGFVSIGDNCSIGKDVHLENTIVLPGSKLQTGRYRNCVISDTIRIAVT